MTAVGDVGQVVVERLQRLHLGPATALSAEDEAEGTPERGVEPAR